MIRARRFESQLETLLERDWRLILQTSLPFSQLRRPVSLLAAGQGRPLNYSLLAKTLGITPPNVRKLILTFEAIFLVRLFFSERSPTGVLFFEDPGIASYLLRANTDPAFDPRRGLFEALLPQFLYRPELAATGLQYRTRGGALVDLVFKTAKGTVGIIPVAAEQATPSALASARSFLAVPASGGDSGSKVIIAHQGQKLVHVSNQLLSLPFPCLLSDRWRLREGGG